MGIIQRLPTEVVNRMAAGEVLARPSNAIKELVENSLDAGATEIVVNVQAAGLKILQVSDNGKGIARDDFDLVCERFATSKLRQFEDLMHMKTYGFRGEALASLSHVSKVNIVSKQADATCAYQANYLDGKMVAPTKPAAGKNGTCITANELFYNLPQRRSKMMSHSEETRMIFDTLMRFAIHRPDVSFALRQNQSNDFRTKGDANFRDVVSCLIGREVADNLISLKLESTRMKFQFSGHMSKPIGASTAKTAQTRKTKQSFFSVFINGRSVKCDILKQPIDDVLANKSLICQFCAVDLQIDESRIDVNVHPTKSSVLFLERDEIVEEIKNYIEKLTNEMFGMQESTSESAEEADDQNLSRIPRIEPIHHVRSIEMFRRTSDLGESRKQVAGGEKKRVDYMEVRTDSKERKLDEFLVKCPPLKEDRGMIESTQSTSDNIENNVSMISLVSQSSSCDEATTMDAADFDLKTTREFEFESLDELRQEICQNVSTTLREMFKTFTFVGSIDPDQVMIQFGTSLYKLQFQTVLTEFFYQTTIFSFGNFGSYKIEDPPKCVELLELAGCLAERFEVFSSPEKREEAERFLAEHAELLTDYFSITLEWREEEGDGDAEKRLYITGIPSLIHYYIPQLEKLPILIASLILDVEYEDEKKCFESICRAISEFFTFSKEFLENDQISAFSTFSWKKMIRQVLMPLIKRKLLPPEWFKNRKVVTQLADAHDLYKVFERCGS